MSFKLAIATAILLAAGVSLGACAVHNWEPGPGVDAADFDAARARCSIFARHSGGGFVAIGSENYVAGATLGHAIGETVRTQRDFNDCMLASGWRIADARSAATPGESDWTKGLWWGAKNRDPSACDAPMQQRQQMETPASGGGMVQIQRMGVGAQGLINHPVF
jgi:hypothetical protein